jgi:hypothetical protein
VVFQMMEKREQWEKKAVLLQVREKREQREKREKKTVVFYDDGAVGGVVVFFLGVLSFEGERGRSIW